MNEADREKCLRSRISRHPVSLTSLSNWFVYFIAVRLFQDIDKGDAGIQCVIGLLDRYVKRLVCH